MLMLVICNPVEDADLEAFRRLVPAEAAALRELKARGAVTDAWSPGRPGAVLMLDVSDEAEAASVTARLPLVQAGLITREIMQLDRIGLLRCAPRRPAAA